MMQAADGIEPGRMGSVPLVTRRTITSQRTELRSGEATPYACWYRRG